MNKKEIIDRIRERIDTCYKDLLFAKNQTGKRYRTDFIEGFRSRLDELILLWDEINGTNFMYSCKELGINYKEVSIN